MPVALKRVGRELRMLVENTDDQTSADPSLLRIIARAHHIQARLIQNTKLSVHDIAREEQVSAAYLYSLLRLPWLAPDITRAIINGRKPQLTAQTLMRLRRGYQPAGLNSESSSAFAERCRHLYLRRMRKLYRKFRLSLPIVKML